MAERKYPSHPVPGVGAVVVGRRGVLLVRRDKDPGTGLWSIPGGGVELGESQEAAVIREVKEETGVDCEVLRLLTTADVITPDSSGSTEYHFILNHYLARALSETTRPEIPEAEVGWFHPDDLPDDIVDTQVRNLILSVSEDALEMMREVGNTSG